MTASDHMKSLALQQCGFLPIDSRVHKYMGGGVQESPLASLQVKKLISLLFQNCLSNSYISNHNRKVETTPTPKIQCLLFFSIFFSAVSESILTQI